MPGCWAACGGDTPIYNHYKRLPLDLPVVPEGATAEGPAGKDGRLDERPALPQTSIVRADAGVAEWQTRWTQK